MIKNKEMAEALNRLSQLANEEAFGEDIPEHFISTINHTSPSKHSNSFSGFAKFNKFSNSKSIKIENQKRLKFLEELSEIRDKPEINSNYEIKVNSI